MRKRKQTDHKPHQPQQRTPNDLSRCLVPLDADQTLVAVIELSLTSWLVSGIVPGVERQPLAPHVKSLSGDFEILAVDIDPHD